MPLCMSDHVVAGAGAATTAHGVGAVGDEGLTGELPDAGLAVLVLADLVLRLALPEREQDVAAVLLVLLRDVEGVLGTVADGVELVAQPAPGEVGREGAGAGCTAGGAHDKLVVLDDEGRGLTAVTEGLGAQLDLGHAGVGLHDLGDRAGAVHGDAGDLLEEVVLQANLAVGGAVGHVVGGVNAHGRVRAGGGGVKLVRHLLEHLADSGALLVGHVLAASDSSFANSLRPFSLLFRIVLHCLNHAGEPIPGLT